MYSGSLIISSIVAISVFLLYMVVMQFTNKQQTMRERIRRIAVSEDNENAHEESFNNEQEPSPFGSSLNRILRVIGIDTETFIKKSQLRFYQSGIQSPDAPIYYLFFKRIGIGLFIIIAIYIIMSQATGMAKLLHYAEAIILIFLGIFGPDLVLQNQRTKREQILQNSFPDALDLLLICVESGLALDGALARTCKELGTAHPEITQELNRTRLELTLLNDRAMALNNLAERTNILPFRSLVATLLQSERFGTSLTDTLRVLSEDYRNTRLMNAENKAGRLPVLMTIPLITMLMPALFLIILGPAILKLMGIVHSE
jgi:tight adherence protein C